MENKMLKKKVFALEREVAMLKKSRLKVDEEVPLPVPARRHQDDEEVPLPVPARRHQDDEEVPLPVTARRHQDDEEVSLPTSRRSSSRDSLEDNDEVMRLREELMRSREEAIGYKLALEEKEQIQSGAQTAQNGIVDISHYQSLQTRIHELEVENSSLLEITLTALDKNAKLLTDVNNMLREKTMAEKKEKLTEAAAAKRKQYARTRSSVSIANSSCTDAVPRISWNVQLSATVTSVNVENGEATYRIDVEAYQGASRAVRWHVSRTYSEFRGLRNCIELKRESKL